jgi:hypothetical protein
MRVSLLTAQGVAMHLVDTSICKIDVNEGITQFFKDAVIAV